MTININLKNVSGSLLQNKVKKPTVYTHSIKLSSINSTSNSVKISVKPSVSMVNPTSSNGSFISYPDNIPSITTSAINDLSKFTTIETVAERDNITYSNTISYITSNYTNTSSLILGTLNNIEEPQIISNNSTILFDNTINKYVVKQMNLDGGNF